MAANASTDDHVQGRDLSPIEALAIIKKELRMINLKRRASLIALIIVTMTSGVINNVSYYEMGQKMKGTKYAPFYLYLASIWYSIVYGFMVFIRSRDKLKLHHWRWYLLLGIVCSVGGVFSQFSNPFVDGTLQSLFGLMTLPGTVIGNRLFLGRKTTFVQMIGVSIVLIGQVFAVLPPMISGLGKDQTLGQNNIVACLCFIVGVITTGSGVDVIQQKIFSPSVQIDVWVQLFLASLIGCFLNVFTIFLPMLPPLGSISIQQVASDQKDSFLCLFQTHPLPQGCEQGSSIWVFAFLISSTLYYYLQSSLVQTQDSIFQGVVLALVVPISCAMFAIPYLGGEVFGPYIALSLVLTLLGTIVFRLATTETFMNKANEALVRIKNRFVSHPNYGTNE